jgi:hypothetical protein
MRKLLRPERVLTSAVFLWLVAVLINFYAIQKPIKPAQVPAIARTGWNLVVALLMLGAATRIGRWLLPFLAPPNLGISEEGLFSLALGWGGLSLGSLALGLSGLARPLVVGPALVLLCVALFPWRTGLRTLGKAAIGEWRTWSLPLRLFLIAVWGLAFLLVLAPPTGFDALLYHLTAPKWYAQAGRILPGLDIPQAYFPTLMETLYLDTLTLRAEVAAKLLHFTFGLILIAAVYLAARHYWGRQVGRWAVVLTLSMPMITLLATWAYNDLALACYSFLALYALVRWRDEQGRWWALAGAMAASAMGMKYTAFVVPLTLGILTLWWGRGTPRQAIVHLGRLAALTALIALPWYAKSWALTGNPIYPFLFGGRFWDSFRAASYRQSGTGIGWDPLALLNLPWVATMGYRDATFWGGRTGPLLLVLLPAVVLVRFRLISFPGTEKGRRFIDSLLFFALLSYAFWSFGVVQSALLWQTRLLLPALVPLAVACAWAFHHLGRLDTPTFSLQHFLTLAIGLVLGLQIVSQTMFVLNNNPLHVIVGLETRDSYLQRNLSTHYEAMQAIGRETPEDARVFFLYEPRSYYSPRPTQPDALLDNFGDALYHFQKPEKIVAQWQAQGYTHVLIAWWGVHFLEQSGTGQLDPATQAVLQAVVKNHLREIYRDPQGDYALYGISSE